MRTALLLVVALASTGPLAHEANAGECQNCNFSLSTDAPVRCAARHRADEVRFSIKTDNRNAVLLLTDDVVALQLSDRVLHKLDRKMREAEDEEDCGLGSVIKTAVLASVRSLLDHSADCDIADISFADYRDGELVLRGPNGEHIFANASIDDEEVMRSFSESDARAFVRELRRQMERKR